MEREIRRMDSMIEVSYNFLCFELEQLFKENLHSYNKLALKCLK